MRVQSISSEPIHQIPYLQAGTSGRTDVADLPILLGTVSGLPSSLDAIICTADLQGVTLTSHSEQDPQLLGEVAAEELAVLLELSGIQPSRSGVILAGDLYSAPKADVRGASGDVSSVWDAFGRHYRWVVGVLGNHDSLGPDSDTRYHAADSTNTQLLDGTTCTMDGLLFAGISGIIGNPAKPLRRSATDYVSALERLNRTKPDVVILHQAPAMEGFQLRGASELEATYQRHSYGLTICGHVWWSLPFVELDNHNQLLNVDSRVIVLRQTDR